VSRGKTPSDNPFDTQRQDKLAFIEHDHALTEVADRLKRQRYRGAICGPKGSGKTTMLRALGEELMEHGLTPLPLFIDEDRHKALPTNWRCTVRRARPTDALLLDGYDMLPMWARAWVLLSSKRAGAVIVTSEREVILPTVAQLSPSSDLLRGLIDQLDPSAPQRFNVDALYEEARGNLRDALQLAYELHAQDKPAPALRRKNRAPAV